MAAGSTAGETDGIGIGDVFESVNESVASSASGWAAAAERAPRRRASSGDVMRGCAHRTMARVARLHSDASAAPG